MDIIERLASIACCLEKAGQDISSATIRDAIVEIEAHGAANVGGNEGWRPIETAPKIAWSRAILVSGPGDALEMVTWFAHIPGWANTYTGHPITWSPTHWRPLPDTPKCGAAYGANPPTVDNLEAPQALT